MVRIVATHAAGHRLARVLITVVTPVMLFAVTPAAPRAAATLPLRTFWVTRSALETPDAVRRAMTTASSGAFDTVMMPLSIGSARLEFDGVREMLKETRERGLRAYVWVDVTLAAAAGELPGARDHVLYQHPEWLMVPRELAPDLLKVDVRSPAYLGMLARWVRANTPRIDGLYVSPLDPEAATYLTSAVVAAVKRYSVDGVFLDAVRFPGTDFDYSHHAMEIFRADRRATMTPAERVRLEEIEAIDPFGYAEEFPEEWRAFRQARLTALLARLKKALVAINPALVVSAGIASDPHVAQTEAFQDWPTWVATGLVDGLGRRNGATGTVVFTADGLSAASGPLPNSPAPEAAATR